jgi:hypothetical protein
MIFRYLAGVAVFLVVCSVAQAQNGDLGTWNILNARYTYNSKWSFFGEAQLRSLKTYNHFHYYEYKGGVNYKVSSALLLSVAAGDYDTYGEGGNFVVPKNNDEFRLWPQVLLQQTVGRFRIEQRYRYEARFTSAGFRNRFRYRVGVNYPFGKAQFGQTHRSRFSVNNELFFTNREPYFERNRFMATLSRYVSETMYLQIGYLSQFDYRINDETGRDFLVVGVYLEWSRKAAATQTEKSAIEP